MLKTEAELFQAEVCRLHHAYGVQVFSKRERWVWLWELIDLFFYLWSDRGKASDVYTTVIGPYIFFKNSWSEQNATAMDVLTLKHEEVHIRWQLNLGLGNIWLGTLIFLLLYFLFLLPVGLAYFRYAAERAAYVITYKEAKKLGITYDIETFVTLLSGPSYVWAWPFKSSIRRYFIKHCETSKK